MNCKVCAREAVKDGYCESHLKAYENIIEKYVIWKKALEVSWKEYLSEIAKFPLAGKWAKEVAKYLTESEEKENVTDN